MNKNNRGFTLIELMITIVIIGFLATLVLNYSTVQKNTFLYRDENHLLAEVFVREISNTYQLSDWASVSESEYEEDGVIVGFTGHSMTSYGTEAIELTVTYLGQSHSYVLERVINIE